MNTTTFTRNETYWYARGYYDARAHGSTDRPPGFMDGETAGACSAYRQGYDTGLADYCEFEILVDNEPEPTDQPEEQ